MQRWIVTWVSAATIAIGQLGFPMLEASSAKSAQPNEYPPVAMGLPTNLSIQILRCFRANVDEYGRNNVVVVQFRVRKIGPNTAPVKYFGDDRINTIDIAARDPVLLENFTVIKDKRSNDLVTGDWKVGQYGDGYCWFKVPERVKMLDVFFPKTQGIRVNIEIPKA